MAAFKITVLLLSAISLYRADKIADILFKTNINEIQDAKLTFDKPIPYWLKGTLMRNGLGRFEVGDRKFTNALDAFAKLSSWRFPGDGYGYFTARMIYAHSYSQSLVDKYIAPYALLDTVDPHFNIIEELETLKNGPDNMNINIFNFGGDKLDFVAVADYWNLYTIDPRTLKTVRAINPKIPNTTISTATVLLGSAHPLPEYGTKNYLTFLSVASAVPGEKSKLIFVRATSAEDREVIATIAVDKASYMHSFAVTENYAVLLAVPFYVNPLGTFKDFRPLDALEWVPTDVTQLHVINTKTGSVQTMKTENMFFLHVVNAYESDLFSNEIVIDVCSFKDTGGLHQMEMSRLHDQIVRKNSSLPILKRYTLNLKNGDVNLRTFDGRSNVPYANKIDFPTINENYRSKHYCYTYGIAYNYNNHDFLDMALVKKNFFQDNNDISYVVPGMYLNEAVFVPDPNGKTEDDGDLVLPVLDISSEKTNFTIFNATDLTILSSAQLPTNLPFGTHGHFFDYLV